MFSTSAGEAPTVLFLHHLTQVGAVAHAVDDIVEDLLLPAVAVVLVEQFRPKGHLLVALVALELLFSGGRSQATFGGLRMDQDRAVGRPDDLRGDTPDPCALDPT